MPREGDEHMAGTTEDDIVGNGALGCGCLAVIVILIGVGNFQSFSTLNKLSFITAAWLGLSIIIGFARNFNLNSKKSHIYLVIKMVLIAGLVVLGFWAQNRSQSLKVQSDSDLAFRKGFIIKVRNSSAASNPAQPAYLPTGPHITIIDEDLADENLKSLSKDDVKKACDSAAWAALIKTTSEKVGVYHERNNSGRVTGSAYRTDWNVRLVNLRKNEIAAEKSFRGGSPPASVREGSDGYGETPEKEYREWLSSLKPGR
jgi:hypothetical protein